MLDERTQMMLEAASMLTAEDLEFLRTGGRPAQKHAEAFRASLGTVDVIAKSESISTELNQTSDEDASQFEQVAAADTPQHGGRRNRQTKTVSSKHAQKSASSLSPGVQTAAGSSSRGEYERNRTRESKVSTACLGAVREKHEWWPLGTELVARLGNEVFEATVVKNPSVKSGRSLVITSGPAQGKVCITPTRAAIEATEAFRAANHLGRGGGVTNGWTFWQPKN